MEVWNSVASTCMYYTEKEVLSMENYSPVSTLLRMSKSIERILNKRIRNFTIKIFTLHLWLQKKS